MVRNKQITSFSVGLIITKTFHYNIKLYWNYMLENVEKRVKVPE